MGLLPLPARSRAPECRRERAMGAEASTEAPASSVADSSDTFFREAPSWTFLGTDILCGSSEGACDSE